MRKMCISIMGLALLFTFADAQDTNAGSGSTLDPTITGIIAGVGVIVVLGLAFLLWRVPRPLFLISILPFCRPSLITVYIRFAAQSPCLFSRHLL